MAIITGEIRNRLYLHACVYAVEIIHKSLFECIGSSSCLTTAGKPVMSGLELCVPT